jgi:hypothetical protein
LISSFQADIMKEGKDMFSSLAVHVYVHCVPRPEEKPEFTALLKKLVLTSCPRQSQNLNG